jgi:hypothetical protein
MKLALRSTLPNNAGWKDIAADRIIRARLVTDYPHGGIVVGDTLYHSTTKKGVHTSEYTPELWLLIDVGGDDELAIKRFSERQGNGYDWLSLLSFVGVKATDSGRDYCYELCHYMMTGHTPDHKVTPESLLVLAHQIRGE